MNEVKFKFFHGFPSTGFYDNILSVEDLVQRLGWLDNDRVSSLGSAVTFVVSGYTSFTSYENIYNL